MKPSTPSPTSSSFTKTGIFCVIMTGIIVLLINVIAVSLLHQESTISTQQTMSEKLSFLKDELRLQLNFVVQMKSILFQSFEDSEKTLKLSLSSKEKAASALTSLSNLKTLSSRLKPPSQVFQLPPGGKRFIVRTTVSPSFLMAIGDPSVDEHLSFNLFTYGCWDLNIARVMRKLLKTRCKYEPSSLVVDIGANMGFFSLYGAALGCRVTSFEIQKNLIHLHKTSISLNAFQSRINLIHHAVSDLNQTLYFRVFDQNPGGVGVVQSYFSESTEQVESVRLDQVVKQNVVFMKIDVEGHEEHVILSGEGLFNAYQIENIVVELRKRQVDLAIHLLIKGYSVCTLSIVGPTYSFQNNYRKSTPKTEDNDEQNESEFDPNSYDNSFGEPVIESCFGQDLELIRKYFEEMEDEGFIDFWFSSTEFLPPQDNRDI